jgi:hypothetical protein
MKPKRKRQLGRTGYRWKYTIHVREKYEDIK